MIPLIVAIAPPKTAEFPMNSPLNITFSKFPKKIWLHGLAMVIAVTICYMFGTVWFTIQANVDFKSALYMCVIPFILGDVIKIVLALVVGPAIYHALKKANLN